MKKVLSTLVLAVVMLTAPMTQAENLGAEQARDAAARFMRHNTALTRLTADQLTLVRQWDNPNLGVPSMYLFSTTGEGWIIMAATTCMDPIVGFSDDSEINPDCLAPQLEMWLDAYSDLICQVQDDDAQKGLDDSAEWTEMMNDNTPASTKAQIIIAKERWDQGGELGTDYNILCPVVNDSVCPVGCVATAMAQICHFYQYPKQAKGRKSYHWTFNEGGVEYDSILSVKYDTVTFNYDTMPNKIVAATTYGSRLEVSRLGYYCGLAVRMDYSPSGSGSHSEYVPDAMRVNFKYQTGTMVKRSSVGTNNFLFKLRRELLQNRPVYMSGVSSSGEGRDAGGHAWICCGYYDSDTTKYYMNWGWNGSGNGFFNLKTNNMAVGVYNFNLYQDIIINMVPPTDSIVGIDEVNPTVGLGHAYPNPASYSVAIPYSLTQAAELQVYDISGRMVECRRLQSGNGEATLRVDALPAGLYVYRLGTAHGKFVVR